MTGVKVSVYVGKSLIWVGVGRSGESEASPRVGKGVIDGTSEKARVGVNGVPAVVAVTTGVRWPPRGATPSKTNPTQ
jgi:hypothetical protein